MIPRLKIPSPPIPTAAEVGREARARLRPKPLPEPDAVRVLHGLGREDDAPLLDGPLPPHNPNAVMLGWPSNLWEASAEQVGLLTAMMGERYPGEGAAELRDRLRAMDATDLYEMLRNDGRDVAPDRYHTGGYEDPPRQAYDADNLGRVPRR